MCTSVCIYTHKHIYRWFYLWALLLFCLYKYVLFPFAPLTVIIIAVEKSLPDNSDMQVITEWIVFFSGNMLKIFPCLFVSWGVVDSSALWMLGCGDLDSVIFFPKEWKVCLNTPWNGLYSNCKFCLVCSRWLFRSLHFSICPAHPGSQVTLEMSQSLSIELGLACHGSLLSAAPQPRLPPLVPSRRTMTASLAESFPSLPPSCASGQGSGKSHKNGNHPPPPELVASFKFQLP